MPTYNYRCAECNETIELVRPIAERDRLPVCQGCTTHMTRLLAAPMGKMAGQVAKGGGANRLTAEALGCKISDLPPALRTRQEDCNG